MLVIYLRTILHFPLLAPSNANAMDGDAGDVITTSVVHAMEGDSADGINHHRPWVTD